MTEPAKDLNEKIKHQIRVEKISKMILPTILMNQQDFDFLKEKVESSTNVILGDNPKYNDIPIKISRLLRPGNIIVYDDYMNFDFQYSLAIKK